MPEPNDKVLFVRMPASLHDALKLLAFSQSESLNGLCVDALRKLLPPTWPAAQVTAGKDTQP